MVLLVRSASTAATLSCFFSGRSSAGWPHGLQRPWSRNVDGVSCGRVLLVASMCFVQCQKCGGSALCLVSSWPGMLKAQFWRSSHGPRWSCGSLSLTCGLDFVHLRGVGEDVGELSVNCGWGFSAVGFQPRQWNMSVGQPQHEVRRFGHVSNFCTKSRWGSEGCPGRPFRFHAGITSTVSI